MKRKSVGRTVMKGDSGKLKRTIILVHQCRPKGDALALWWLYISILVMLVQPSVSFAQFNTYKSRIETSPCPEGTHVQYSSSVSHQLKHEHVSRSLRRRHCVCPLNHVCKGTLCSSAHEHCTLPTDCRLVHGFLASCPDCKCVDAAEVAFTAPQHVFLSMVDRGRALSINFAIEGDVSRPHVTVWREQHPKNQGLVLNQNDNHSSSYFQNDEGKNRSAIIPLQPSAQSRQELTSQTRSDNVQHAKNSTDIIQPTSSHSVSLSPSVPPTMYLRQDKTTTNSKSSSTKLQRRLAQIDRRKDLFSGIYTTRAPTITKAGFPAHGATEILAKPRNSSSEANFGISFWIVILLHMEGEHVCFRAWNGASGTAPACIDIPHTGLDTKSKNLGDENVIATIGVVGDLGMSFSAPLVMHALKHDQALNMLIHPGDVSYAFDVLEMNRYLSRLQGLVSHIPYQVCLGNHEANNERVLNAFLQRFPTDVLGADSSSNTGHWYSFNAYGIHFVFLDTESDTGPGSRQYEWLSADLSCVSVLRSHDKNYKDSTRGSQGDSRFTFESSRLSNDRVQEINHCIRRIGASNIHWVVLVFHYPMYSTHRRVSSDERASKFHQMTSTRKHLEPLLYKYGVNFVFTGHDHVYERTYPVYNQTIDQSIPPRAPVHIVVGTGGHNIYESWYNLPSYDG